MTKDDREFKRNVNVDKARKKVPLAIIVLLVSIFTYIPPLILDNDFDFGIIFEIISLILLLLAYNYMRYYDEDKSRILIVMSAFSCFWLFIYDLIIYIFESGGVLEFFAFIFDYIYEEIFFIIYFIILFRIYLNLIKADDPEKYKESTDWFYETLDQNNKEDE